MLAINKKTSTKEKIFRRVKRLREHMQPDEEPLLAVAAIWDNGQEDHSTPCEVIVTNQRLLGYYSANFPRKRFFLDELSLSTVTSVSLLNKTYEPLFRELLVRDNQRKVYIRAPRRYIEALFAALRLTIEQYAPTTQPIFEDMLKEGTTSGASAPIYGRQDIRTSFASSPLAVMLLFVGGLVLEILGFVLWGATQNVQVGIPLFVAGMIAVLVATFVRRKRS